ncbi:hypothetical protein LOAG_13035 [Loa loa]|uniref:Uncharacterized protein n=1 Tax=Loa loa TaxID=7209 RepID=A0A1S0TK72_LOALO|nr:hypothetical protein LOAG_13035 [Loa loa]EFO15473.1 hypothetical protein LOAG_13035 [Loa loa]
MLFGMRKTVVLFACQSAKTIALRDRYCEVQTIDVFSNHQEVFIEWWGRHLFIAVVLNVKVDLLLLMLTVMASQLSHQLKRMKFCHLLRCIAAVMRSKPPSL